MFAITQNLQAVRAQISQAALAAGRAPNAVQLLAVSKTFGADAVLAAVQAGQLAFGENYLQEALDKILKMQELVPQAKLEWHFIGPIQSNKTRPIAEHFAWVHTVERSKIAQRLSEQRPPNLPALNICLQINISGETSKSGCAPEQALALAREVSQLPGLRLRGLMAIPAPVAQQSAASAAQPFAQMQELFQDIAQHLGAADFDTLSLGMSADMALAIAHGSTMVRLGSAIFGQRHYQAESSVLSDLQPGA